MSWCTLSRAMCQCRKNSADRIKLPYQYHGTVLTILLSECRSFPHNSERLSAPRGRSDDVVGSYMAAHAQEVTADLQGSNRPRKSLAAPSTRDPPRHPPQLQ